MPEHLTVNNGWKQAKHSNVAINLVQLYTYQAKAHRKACKD